MVNCLATMSFYYLAPVLFFHVWPATSSVFLHRWRDPRDQQRFIEDDQEYATLIQLPEPENFERQPQNVQKHPYGTISLCDYWKALHVEREECGDVEHSESFNDDYAMDKRLLSFEIGLPVCRLKYLQASCVATDKCKSGIVCLDFQSQRCCQPMPGTCPTPSQMGYKCKVYTPVSWCTGDADCKGKKCCPTGCNYNVCA